MFDYTFSIFVLFIFSIYLFSVYNLMLYIEKKTMKVLFLC